MPTLQFKGKPLVQNHHLVVPFCELEAVRSREVNPSRSLHDNLIVEGDNLKALKALRPAFHGKVKCIYIDPPYNTGNEGWIYNDKVNSPMMRDWLDGPLGSSPNVVKLLLSKGMSPNAVNRNGREPFYRLSRHFWRHGIHSFIARSRNAMGQGRFTKQFASEVGRRKNRWPRPGKRLAGSDPRTWRDFPAGGTRTNAVTSVAMKTAVITGAGSGVGKATAIALAQQGWNVALVGRRENLLLETAGLAGEHGVRVVTCVCDIGDAAAVAEMGRSVIAELGEIEVLVNAAGTNAPQRSLEVLSLADYHAMIDTNMNGAYYCVQAFLPQMRARGSGTIVNIVSDAARQASPKAGPGYSMSKFGVVGLTQAINAEERPRGIRATAILPGDIDTPLLDKRPAPPDAAARAKMMQPEDIAECVLLAINLPARATIEEMLVRPSR